MRMKSVIQYSFLCIAPLAFIGCDRPDNSVDTTLPTEEAAKMAVISGALSYPSEYIPDDMKVCAQEVGSRKTFCNSKATGGTTDRRYELTVPAGSYHVYAKTSEKPGYYAYYTEAVVCGLTVDCLSSMPIPVVLAAGDRRLDIDPQDWYADGSRPAPSLPQRSRVSPNKTWLVGTWADEGFCEGDSGETYSSDQSFGTWSEGGRWSLSGNRLTVTIDMYVRDTESGEPEPINPPRTMAGAISNAENDSFVFTVNGEERNLKRC